MTHPQGILVALAALPFLAGACPDAPRAAAKDDTAVVVSKATPPARVARAALLLEAPADVAAAPALRGAVVFEETTVTAHDGTRVVTLAVRYRVLGLTGPYETRYRLRVDPVERCADVGQKGPGLLVGHTALEAINGEAEGSYDELRARGLDLAHAVVGHAVVVIDGDDKVLVCGVARLSPEHAP